MTLQTKVTFDGAKSLQGVRNVRLQKIWRALFSCNASFEIRSFGLLSTNYRKEFGNPLHSLGDYQHLQNKNIVIPII